MANTPRTPSDDEDALTGFPKVNPRYFTVELAKVELGEFVYRLAEKNDLTMTEMLFILNRVQGELLSDCIKSEQRALSSGDKET